MRLPVHHYRFVAEKPITELSPQLTSRFLVFVAKGTTCAVCGIVGTRLIKGVTHHKQYHWDVYDEGLTTMLTNGHIVPKAHGGSRELYNLRPLCARCNSKEGTRFDHILNDRALFMEACYNRLVKAKTGGFPNNLLFATVKDIFRSDGKCFFELYEGFVFQANQIMFLKNATIPLNSNSLPHPFHR